MNIRIITATHKQYKMPKDGMYLPIHVGKAKSPKSLPQYLGDNTGENISLKNSNYCELTALYWAWKNLDCDYIGLAHYRRHFMGKKGKDKWSSVLTKEQAETLLKKTDVILPKPRNYFIETTYNQYIHAHNKQDLDETERILAKFYPEYMPAYKEVMNSTKGHRFNMFIMKKEIMDSYCQWLFDVLLRLENVLDISSYSENDARVFGFVSERLLDVWIITNNIDYIEAPVIYMEKQNWLKKGAAFLKRKFLGKGKK